MLGCRRVQILITLCWDHCGENRSNTIATSVRPLGCLTAVQDALGCLRSALHVVATEAATSISDVFNNDVNKSCCIVSTECSSYRQKFRQYTSSIFTHFTRRFALGTIAAARHLCSCSLLYQLRRIRLLAYTDRVWRRCPDGSTIRWTCGGELYNYPSRRERTTS